MSAILITGAGDVIDNIGPQTLLDLIGLFDGYGLVVTDDELLTLRLDELQEERGPGELTQALKLWQTGEKLEAVKLVRRVTGDLKSAYEYCQQRFAK